VGRIPTTTSLLITARNNVAGCFLLGPASLALPWPAWSAGSRQTQGTLQRRDLDPLRPVAGDAHGEARLASRARSTLQVDRPLRRGCWHEPVARQGAGRAEPSGASAAAADLDADLVVGAGAVGHGVQVRVIVGLSAGVGR
jgi:hypothetical protein